MNETDATPRSTHPSTRGHCSPGLKFSYSYIDLSQEGVAITLRVTRDDSWLAKAIVNTYNRLTSDCLVAIVRDFLTCQSVAVPTSVPSTLLIEETRNFLVPALPGQAAPVDAGD